MATISNTPRPGYVWDSTDNVWYPIGVGGHSHSEIAKTIADAKGDLIVGTAADTVDRLAVGNNGESLVADSSTSTGLRYQTGYNSNAIINGGMDIAQRGTTFSTTSSYTLDRWYITFGATGTVTQQTAGATLPTIQYCARVGRNSGNTTAGYQQFFYTLETKDSLRFANQTVTLSFYARAGANFSAASSQMGAILYSGTGTDQRVDGFTGSAQVINQTPTLTTSWQRFQYTATVGTTATEIGMNFYYLTAGTAGANDYFEITGVQLELGAIATTFKRSSGGTIQGELAACQRYYVRFNGGSGYGNIGSGWTNGTTQIISNIAFPVQMRVIPTTIDYTAVKWYQGGAVSAISTVTLSYESQTSAGSLCGGTGYSANTAGSIFGQSGYIGYSAEL